MKNNSPHVAPVQTTLSTFSTFLFMESETALMLDKLNCMKLLYFTFRQEIIQAFKKTGQAS